LHTNLHVQAIFVRLLENCFIHHHIKLSERASKMIYVRSLYFVKQIEHFCFLQQSRKHVSSRKYSSQGANSPWSTSQRRFLIFL